MDTLTGNKIIAEFMGYTHIKDNVLYDTCTDYQYKHYTYETVYSETPIYIDSEGFLQEVKNPDYGNKENPRWNPELETLGWASVNKHFINPEYHTSWNWLMPVIEKINTIDNREYDVIIFRSDCHINSRDELLFEGSRFKEVDTIIGIVWNCIILFIQWYNTQSHHPQPGK